MRILVDITHPAYVHFFRHAIDRWQQSGVDILITSRKKDVTTDLLDEFGFEHHCLSTAGKGLHGLTRELILRNWKIARLMDTFKPNVVTACAGPFLIYGGIRHGVPRVVFYDTEHDHLNNALVYPTATVVATPRSFDSYEARKHIRYAGYHATAYTHPNVFTPDADIVQAEGYEPGEYIIVRLVNWAASHDIGDHGVQDLRQVVKTLQAYGQVILSSEIDLPDDLATLQFRGQRRNMLHLQAHAKLFFGESATMASECVMLGVPSVFVSTSQRGYINEQEAHYDMVYAFYDRDNGQFQALAKAIELLEDPTTSQKWRRKHARMLDELIDVTEFIVDTVESYA